jgi:DNA invertase Pin-like site-specific DNA recombinase
MRRDATRREFDVIMAWSVDRLGRSLQDLISFLSEIHAAGVDLYPHQQGLDTSTPAGKAMFQMPGVFAEFERALIRERVMAGLARAKKHGTKSGNPFGRPKIDAAVEALIRQSLTKGAGTKATARAVGVGIGTVLRIKTELAE